MLLQDYHAQQRDSAMVAATQLVTLFVDGAYDTFQPILG